MKKWYDVKVIPQKNATSEAEITIFDEIGMWGVDASNFKADLDKVKNLSSIKLLINSPGGSVFDGIAIYNMLKDVRDKLTVEVSGLAASIASIIAMAGGTRVMREGTFLMIHNPWTMMVGDADDMRKEADTLDQIKDQLVSIYVNNSNLDSATIEMLMSEETWMDAETAEEYGFISKTIYAPKIAASFNKKLKEYGFKNGPKDTGGSPKEKDDMEYNPVMVTVEGIDYNLIPANMVTTNGTETITLTETTMVQEADVSASDVDAREALLKQILVFKINNFLNNEQRK